MKKGFCDEKSLFIKLFSPIKRWFSLRNGGDAAQSGHGAGQTAEDLPHGKRRSLYNDRKTYSASIIQSPN
jgi:hypothetical protein